MKTTTSSSWLEPELYAKAVAEFTPGSRHRCNTFVAGREYVDAAMYPNPATMKLVNGTDAQGDMRNTG
jgi:hypothetical protein